MMPMVLRHLLQPEPNTSIFTPVFFAEHCAPDRGDRLDIDRPEGIES